MRFLETPIQFGEVVTTQEKRQVNNGRPCILKTLHSLKVGKEDLKDIQLRVYGQNRNFTNHLIYDDEVFPSIVSGSDNYHHLDCRIINGDEYCQVGSFPLDYNFQKVAPKYLIGMSVPPVMMAQIAHQIWLQWILPKQ